MSFIHSLVYNFLVGYLLKKRILVFYFILFNYLLVSSSRHKNGFHFDFLFGFCTSFFWLFALKSGGKFSVCFFSHSTHNNILVWTFFVFLPRSSSSFHFYGFFFTRPHKFLVAFFARLFFVTIFIHFFGWFSCWMVFC